MKRFLCLALVLLVPGCFTPVDPNAVAPPVQRKEPSQVCAIVLDVSGSFSETLETKGWPFIQKIIRDFYRSSMGNDDDILIIGQISAVPVAPIFEGSPRDFAKLYGDAKSFQKLVRSKSNPNGSRVHDSIADVAEYALTYGSVTNQVFLCVLSDFEDNFPDSDGTEVRLTKVLGEFAKPNRAVGFYWVDLPYRARWEANLRKAGVKNSVLSTSIDASPRLPRFD